MNTIITRALILLAAIILALRPAVAARVSLTEQDRYALCPQEPALPTPPLAEIEDYEAGTTLMSAEEAEAHEQGISTLRGSVELARDGQALGADLLTYDQEKDVVDAQGQVTFWGKDVFWSGRHGWWHIEGDVARLEDGDYRLLKRRGHGRAGAIQNESKQHRTRLEDGDYTTCDAGNRVWTLSAKDIELDHIEEWGRAKHAFLAVRDVPILYLPYISFPLSDKRKSGFVTPTVGVRTRTGIDISVPYYWNIAPEQDATFAPRYMGDRGEMLNGQYRYLLRSGHGQADFGYLPSDRQRQGDDRFLVALTHQQAFPEQGINSYLTYNKVSDSQYFEDLGTSLDQASARFLERRADLSYSGGSWSVLGRLLDYQSINPVATPTYRRLPSIYLSRGLPTGVRNLSFQFLSESTYFDRDQGVTGERLDVRPGLIYQLHTPGMFLIPRLSVRHTQYFLNDAGESKNPGRSVPILSVDGGLFFERDLELGGGSYLQTLEPRLFYLYLPRVDQHDLPVFDTAQYDFSYYQLFREDRFSGPDRVGDANQLSVGLSSRIMNRETGLDRLRVSVGQILYFQNREVTLPGGTIDREPVSDLVGEVTTRLSKALSGRVNLTWDPKNAETRKATFGVRYWPTPDTILNAEYRLRRDIVGLGQTDVEQTDVSARFPLSPNWAVLGRWLFSLDTMETVEAVGGIEYDSCCWGVRAVARRYVTSATGQFNNAFFVQLELKGLGGLGRKTASFLKKSIPGYQSEF